MKNHILNQIYVGLWFTKIPWNINYIPLISINKFIKNHESSVTHLRSLTWCESSRPRFGHRRRRSWWFHMWFNANRWHHPWLGMVTIPPILIYGQIMGIVLWYRFTNKKEIHQTSSNINELNWWCSICQPFPTFPKPAKQRPVTTWRTLGFPWLPLGFPDPL